MGHLYFKWQVSESHTESMKFQVSLSLSLSLSHTHTHTHNPFLSSIDPGRSPTLPPMSARSWCIKVLVGQPIRVHLWVRVHDRTSLMSSSLFPQQCPVWVFLFCFFVCLFVCFFVGFFFLSYLDGLWYGRQVVVLLLFRGALLPGFVQNGTQHSFVVPMLLFLSLWVKWEANGRTAAVSWGAASRNCSKDHAIFLCCSQVDFSLIVYSCIDRAATWKNYCFILTDSSNFHIVYNMPIAVHAFPIRVFT